MEQKIFGLSEQAIRLCEERAVTLSSNIINSSTPGYKAKDMDFANIMQQQGNESISLSKTNSNHIDMNGTVDSPRYLYRVPNQISLDGNTVDAELERQNFVQNAIRYQVNLTFIQNKTEEISKAIRGE
jgi:flagellar basal-body rod protein FlgB